MDALSLNLLQSGAPATSGIAADAQPADYGVACIDFSALLALGLSASAQEQQATQDESTPDAALSAGAQASPANAAELLIALPQQPLAAEAPARVASAPAALGVNEDTGLDSVLETQASSSSAASKAAAVVADAPANIAGGADEPTRATQPSMEIQGADQQPNVTANSQDDMIIALDRATGSDATARSESFTASAHTAAQSAPAPHAAPILPAENRVPISQPSALLEVQAPVSEPGFADALSRHVVWMVDKDAQIAELRINPPDLGPVEVRLTLTQDSAAAEFVSPHAEVRAAIESAIVRLREAMAEVGIQLGEASVSSESFSAQSDAQPQARHTREGYREATLAAGDNAQSNFGRPIVARGLVDVFA